MHHDEAMHQMSDDQFELPLEGKGEALRGKRSDEACSELHSTERSGNDDNLLDRFVMERVIERGNLLRALKRVRRNQGSPGVDGLTVEGLPAYLRENWKVIRGQLLAGRYQPSAVKRCEIPKPGGGVRQLGIPTVLDRFIQQAVLQVLQPVIDPTFSEHSYGFRPGRRAHDFANMVELDRHEGTPQGGPLSPLLANVLLDEVDKELERRGHRFVRSADDCNVYVRSKRAGERVMQGLVRLYAKLRLRVNASKSAVARAWERSFLGYSFW